MNLEIITRSDLVEFKSELFGELRNLFSQQIPTIKNWMKSREVRKLLGISAGTLQTLRNNGTLGYTRIGGTIYYSSDDIQKALQPLIKPRII